MTLTVVVTPHGPALARGRHPLTTWLADLSTELRPDVFVAVSARTIGDVVPVLTGEPRIVQDYVTTVPDHLLATYEPQREDTLGGALVKAGRAADCPVQGSMDMALDSGHWTPLVHLAPNGARVVGTGLARVPADALVRWGEVMARTLAEAERSIVLTFAGAQAPEADSAAVGPEDRAWNDRLASALRDGDLARRVLEGRISDPHCEGGLEAVALLGGIVQGRVAKSVRRGADGSVGAVLR